MNTAAGRYPVSAAENIAALMLTTGRMIRMSREIQKTVTGAGIGMAVGAMAGAAGSLLWGSRRHNMKRRARHAANVFGDMLDSVSLMFR